jgi:hypothetical protein
MVHKGHTSAPLHTISNQGESRHGMHPIRVMHARTHGMTCPVAHLIRRRPRFTHLPSLQRTSRTQMDACCTMKQRPRKPHAAVLSSVQCDADSLRGSMERARWQLQLTSATDCQCVTRRITTQQAQHCTMSKLLVTVAAVLACLAAGVSAGHLTAVATLPSGGACFVSANPTTGAVDFAVRWACLAGMPLRWC